jgi:hypothetical protein
VGILYVNPARRTKKRFRVSGRAKVGRHNPRKRRGGKRKGRMPAALAAYWKKKRRKARRNPAQKKRRGGHKKKRKAMAKRKRRRARRGKRRSKRRSRRRGRKRGRGGKRRRRRGRKRARGGRRRKRRGGKRRRRRGRKRARGGRRRKRRKRKGGGRRRKRRSSGATTVVMRRGPHGTLIMNPRRRRRRKSRRRGRRRASRRYGRKFRRNVGAGMLLDLAKRAAPVLIGLYGARLLVSKLGPRIPGVSRLGALQSPLLAVGAVIAVNFATKKIGRLAKYRSELLLGTGLNMVDALISAFAPASVKAAIGVGDVYDRALGEYLHAGAGAPAEDPSMAMGEYVQMGEYVAVGDVEEELGAVEEELGMVEEELGLDDTMQGVARGSMLRPVERQAMLAPVPTRSYTRGVDRATAAWEDPRDFYQGIFAGGAKGSSWYPGD